MMLPIVAIVAFVALFLLFVVVPSKVNKSEAAKELGSTTQQ